LLVFVANFTEHGHAPQNGVARLKRGEEVVCVVVNAVADIPSAVYACLERYAAEILPAAHQRKAAMRSVVCGRAVQTAVAYVGPPLIGILEGIAELR
jgi:hypothetical protein